MFLLGGRVASLSTQSASQGESADYASPTYPRRRKGVHVEDCRNQEGIGFYFARAGVYCRHQEDQGEPRLLQDVVAWKERVVERNGKAAVIYKEDRKARRSKRELLGMRKNVSLGHGQEFGNRGTIKEGGWGRSLKNGERNHELKKVKAQVWKTEQIKDGLLKKNRDH